MVVWSCLKNIRRLNTLGSAFGSFKNATKTKVANFIPVRASHENVLHIRTSTYPLKKVKDMIIFYVMLGAIPFVALITYVNIFIGPAELALIPEGYEPKHWEYYKHPITRFFARYIVVSPQERYERNLHNIFRASEILGIKKLKKDIRNKMKERLDYQSWYFENEMTSYGRKVKEDAERFKKEESFKGPLVLE